MKVLSILGATGSIGTQALDIVRQFPDRFRVAALTAHTRVDLLARQIVEFSPDLVAVSDTAHANQLRALLPPDTKVCIVTGPAGYTEAATWPETRMVLGAMVGAAGLLPTLSAIDAGKDIALANKETLVMAGEMVMRRVAERSVTLMPVDSEHSAIFQSIRGHRPDEIREILLTASGGPFLKTPAADFSGITPAAALCHPNWSMGNKITIDSSTLMNKGLEVIEARWLFDVDFSRIRVVIHPQSIIHSMVAYHDGAVMAQLGIPNMKGAIAYGLSYPERLPLGIPAPDFPALGQLTFDAPDLARFPCLALAFEAGIAGGTCPAVLNAANEVAVAAFLAGQLPYVGIHAMIAETLNRHPAVSQPDIDQILAADQWARKTAQTLIHQQER
ncbi:1-deoxy-D-xylulose-5-phosphate reductoisomerase [Desulfosarcina sp. OttesenSCG-928-G10]|nr:1-deoxy-D-xylulose-5-phosphate reductoisomerase [Desulfosarcina sp. OttesenSCG-928-G10]MDL2320923.1 1-deoxy-D-xylulose-5-phosphate reductoisomerase [Desulfosarcina sp. OttesenSCG-928-B08]